LISWQTLYALIMCISSLFTSHRGPGEASQFVIACLSGAGDAVACYGEEVASGLVLALVILWQSVTVANHGKLLCAMIG
jgi:hypothetical protein